ncbi:M48 family metallopeptidase [Alteromonas sp. ASW11-36]|uniref:M48 family metallopeptidase n=1 Tax=Alteromonas arenosi TaxID=3055817 RepID=A0ABT7STI6_9ALTE|nr:M48 family metallopeptidase [Alteromonas sp. ASW11-36]MDM7859510.1 M48 family metallopeptidase [Alteromonas sp. ASW11-36]
MRKIAMTIATLLLVSSCATSPTGRNQILLYSDDQLSQMGAQAFAGMKESIKISNRPVENQYVQCIADFITAQVGPEVFDGEWEVVVFDDPQVNAFALPGGKIGVYTGLLEVAENQHQLAAVMGHEVGHVIAHHGNERMSQGTLINVGSQVVAQTMAANEVANSGPIMAAIGLGLQVGVQLPFSRTHESEADEIGLELMARAGFKPSEAVELWKNMEAAAGGQRQPEFLSTHPAPQTRIDDLTALLPAATPLYQASRSRPDCKQ